MTAVLGLAFAGFLALGGAWMLMGNAQAAGTVVANTMDRLLEPVVVSGVFPGAPVDEVFVYRYAEEGWEQIPFQIDEVTAGGAYTTTEDSVLDANDEVVFMAGDLGDQAPTAIADELAVEEPWYRVEVTNPLTPTAKGWAYIVRSGTLSRTNGTDYVDYMTSVPGSPGLPGVITNHYAVGWATIHNGIDYTSLFGSGDILDRTKLRVQTQSLGTINENNPLIPKLPLTLIKDGPVRVIVSRGPGYTFAYESYLLTETPVSLGTLNVLSVRISTDLAAGTTGMYYNENVPAGVNIDGVSDVVPTVLTNPWRQISLSSGTTVQVADLSEAGGTPSHYYQDNGATNSADTGDQQSWGDSGFSIAYSPASPAPQNFSVGSAQYILPGAQPNLGATYHEMYQNRLDFSLSFESTDTRYLYLPSIMR